jgi:hypothetical protein
VGGVIRTYQSRMVKLWRFLNTRDTAFSVGEVVLFVFLLWYIFCDLWSMMKIGVKRCYSLPDWC